MNRANRPRLSRISGSSYASRAMSRAGDGSTLSLDFTTGVLDPRLTFTRSTNATFINSQGYVQYADANQQIYSQDQSQSGTWVRQDLNGVNANVVATTDPQGGNTASKLQSSATLQAHLIYSTISTSIASGIAYTFSVYVKKAELKYVALHLASTARYTVVFDLDTGLMTTTNSTGTPLGTAYSSQDAGNGWWRLSATMITQTTTIYPHICLSNAANPGTNASGQPYYTGVLNDGVYTWGAQLNAGSTPLQYIATTTAQKFDQPRFDYDPTTLTPRGLLIEGAAVNLLKYSAYADTNWIAFGGYTKSYITTISSPANDTSAARVTFSAVGHGLYTNNSQMGYTNTVGATYTMSAWIRATSNTTNLNIRFGDSAVGSSPNIPITTTWTRYSYSYVAVSASGPQIQSASGTATGEFEMWGFQLEAGSGASSYIQTGASQGSRAADNCYIYDTTSSGGLSWFKTATQGTFYVEMFKRTAGTAFAAAGFGTRATSSQEFMLYQAVGNNWLSFNWGAGEYTTNYSALSSPFLIKAAVALSPSTPTTEADSTVSINGSNSALNTGPNIVLPFTSDLFCIGSRGSAGGAASSQNYAETAIRRIKFFPFAMTAAQMNAMTTL